MRTGQKVRIAGIQFAGSPDLDRNIRRAGELLDMAAERGARLAILPELWAYPWFVHGANDAAAEMAQPIDGALITEMRERARRLSLYVVVPFYEFDPPTGARYNAAALLTANGEIGGVYRKMHVPRLPGWEESYYFAPGDHGFPVFDTSLGKLGIQLGWDLLFPEGLRALALAGAEIVAAPMAVTAANDDLWSRVVLTGAFVNGLWICRVSRVGQENGLLFAGRSFCAAPTGDLLDEPAGDAEGVTLWTIDRRVVPMVRRDWPLLKERRPDQYGALAAVMPPVAGAPEPDNGDAVGPEDTAEGEQAP